MQAANTRRIYAGSWAAFVRWCKAARTRPVPAAPATIVRFLDSLEARGLKASTIELYAWAIANEHVKRGRISPTHHLIVKYALAGLRRRLGTAPKQKRALAKPDLLRMTRGSHGGARGRRDRAIVLLGWSGALRRSEIVALDVEDVEFSPRGMLVTLRRSKTDQEGKGLVKPIPFARERALCATRAVKAWLATTKASSGPLFRRLGRTGTVGGRLDGREVATAVKRLAARAGLPTRDLGGHSLRSGFVTEAARKGKSLEAIMRLTGHKSESVARGYIRRANVWDDPAGKGLL